MSSRSSIQKPLSPLALAALTLVAIMAFAGNSLLARAAIHGGLIGPELYTAVRLLAGALVLLPFVGRLPARSDLPQAVALFLYAAAFSVAYVGLAAGTGALILFSAVQATIVGIGIARGLRPGSREIAGIALALGGLAWLFAPGLEAPAPGPAMLMTIAGIAWGAYTLYGRGVTDPVAQTARNFAMAGVMALPLLAFAQGPVTGTGLALAVISGAITSGLGYAVWYKVAPKLGLTTVAVSQLATPVATAFAAALLLSEPLTLRLAVAAVLILTGIALVSFARR